ncbi:MAG: hypothetical protein JWQ35_2399 [Bacteriovoracaceae bacterium]|nr:hypothetical protein [Bacteriovoracaceae bacterium]
MSSRHLKSYVEERAQWQTAFDDLLKFGSEGVLKEEILQAKKIFFSKLGSTHEMREELYETSSQSFLEWYLFDYQSWLFSKSPAVVYASLKLGSRSDQELIEKSLFEHWSIYEVLAVGNKEMILDDLLFKKRRQVAYDGNTPDSKLWQVKPGQVIQTRLFELQTEPWFFLTHLWIHSDDEKDGLKKMCAVQSRKWSRHKNFLLECFEAVVRSHGIQNQIRASRSINWLYKELEKKYVKAN